MAKTKVRRKMPNRVALDDANTPVPIVADPVPACPTPVQTGADRNWTRKQPIALRMADLLDDIAARVTLSLPVNVVVRRDLRRYYDAAHETRAEVTRVIGRDGWALLRAATAGTSFGGVKEIRMLWAHVVTHLERQDHEAPMAHALVAFLRNQSIGTLVAIVDALETFAPDVVATAPAVAPPVTPSPIPMETDDDEDGEVAPLAPKVPPAAPPAAPPATA